MNDNEINKLKRLHEAVIHENRKLRHEHKKLLDNYKALIYKVRNMMEETQRMKKEAKTQLPLHENLTKDPLEIQKRKLTIEIINKVHQLIG